MAICEGGGDCIHVYVCTYLEATLNPLGGIYSEGAVGGEFPQANAFTTFKKQCLFLMKMQTSLGYLELNNSV